ncbi:toxin-antitoxin system HicB family antitoxin [Pandoraea bronchicola]|uniref:toxin-antitoxin system HicB family antitoxin n=1 Tax=Pandoraea bronchicola TaxID=2508287 RepID=UPI001FECD65C|nr:toxin-antitoxin system HicB family antitoxin [Pandoraea bronchicola]
MAKRLRNRWPSYRYRGEFRVRIPPTPHRALVIEAAERGVSLNRLASLKRSTN